MALIKNLYIDQGTSFAATTTVTNRLLSSDLDLRNSTIYAHIKKSSESTTITASFHCTYILESHTLIIYLNDDETAAIFPGRYEYDVIVKDINRNSTIRIMEGLVTINSGVTKING